MIPEKLEPRLDLLRQEYVLIQAWKKTSSYIRYHNWFADTLELDRTAINLRSFLAEISRDLQSPGDWKNDPLRIVPAPKSQRWHVTQEGAWEPKQKGLTASRLRPLAHVSIRDQVVATALMLCLADRVESMQGDPRMSVRAEDSRRQVISYGNRLFCDAVGWELRHRWGSAKLYRAYFQDYRSFLARPEIVAEALPQRDGKRVFVVNADLRQFYDRVRPALLGKAIRNIQRDGDDPGFFRYTESLFDWGWHPRDQRNEVPIYMKQAGLDNFTRVALPQGLVASGFFANVVLLSLDERLRRAIGEEIGSGIRLEDACRYVDDLRVTVTVNQQGAGDTEGVKEAVAGWLGRLLEEEAPGLELSEEKTKVAAFGGDERPLVRQSAKMNRIQSAVSGGFDALGGEEVLDAIQGLLRAQETLSVTDESGWPLSPVPDVREETVARFAAARFRTTYRSLRPLLEDEGDVEEAGPGVGVNHTAGRIRVARTRRELDEDARAFALGLIQRWVEDPSNVRLLRIGLDLWPDSVVVREILALLRPFTEKGGRRKAPRRVAWYCLAEIMRAGATETGFVADDECLPSAIDLQSYRKVLCEEAARLVALPWATIPWYLRQQALLFLAAFDPARAPVVRTGSGKETRHYREAIRFLRGEGERLRSSDFSTLAVVARRAFVDRRRAVELARLGISPARKRQLAQRDPSFVLELIDAETDPFLFDDLPARVREDLCRIPESGHGEAKTLNKQGTVIFSCFSLPSRIS